MKTRKKKKQSQTVQEIEEFGNLMSVDEFNARHYQSKKENAYKGEAKTMQQYREENIHIQTALRTTGIRNKF